MYVCAVCGTRHGDDPWPYFDFREISARWSDDLSNFFAFGEKPWGCRQDGKKRKGLYPAVIAVGTVNV